MSILSPDPHHERRPVIYGVFSGRLMELSLTLAAFESGSLFEPKHDRRIQKKMFRG
jgi:hypothetical protein